MALIAGIYWSIEKKDEVFKSNFNEINNHNKFSFVENKKYQTASSEVGMTYWSEKNSLIFSFSGHILNWSELKLNKNDFEGLAKLFRNTTCDGFFKLLKGDYAIAVHDTKEESVILGRDRLGVVPLFYNMNEGHFAFSTRMRFLLRLPNVSKQPRKDFVSLYAGSHYRFFENSLVEETPYEVLKQLPNAHFLIWKKGKTEIFRYWDLEDQPDWTGSAEEMALEYQRQIEKAVARRLDSVKKPAFTLSGGMDSSSVLATAVKYTGEKQHAFSTCHSDKVYDESNEIKSMLDQNVKEWHPLWIDTPDLPSVVQKLMRLHDAPITTVTWMSHYLLCDEVKKQGFDSLFGGLGGDELNAGEFEHFFFFFADLKFRGMDKRLQEEVAGWQKYHDHPIYKKNMGVVENYLSRVVNLKKQGECQPDLNRLNCYTKALGDYQQHIKNFKPVMEHRFKDYLKNRVYQDMTRETIPCCLRAEFFNSMEHSITSFSPFLDHELVEFAFRVPVTLKYNAGVTKHLLRVAMKGILPEETRTRVQKTGWNAPAHLWFSGEGKDMLYDMVNSIKFKNRGIYDQKVVNELLEEHNKIIKEGLVKENHMMFFWQLLNLELWLDDIERIP